MFSDWIDYFWKQLIHIETVQPEVFNLPWLFVVLQPLRFLGMYPALAIVQAVSLVTIVVLCRKMHISWLRISLLMASAPVFSHIVMGQIDGLILLAYLLPPIPAAALVLSKPQTALVVGIDAFRKKPAPVILTCAALLFSAFLIWNYPFSVSDTREYIKVEQTLIPPFFQREWNWTFFPWAFLAVPLLFKKDIRYGMFLSPFLFPYAALNSLIGPMIAAASAKWYWFALFWIVLWLRWAWMQGFF